MVKAKEEESTVEETADNFKTKELEGNGVIKSNVLWSMGVGLIPFPIVDILGTSAVQLRMLDQLTKLYGIEFSKNWGKSAIGSLVGGLGSNGLARVGVSASKMLPFFGTVVGVVASPLASGASTYAIGKIFLQHFASGGTFLDFNPEKVREHFAHLFEEGKLVASNMKGELKKA
ncbi:MAG: DUF697 domain-containing protein [SAR324 cluster bacterium]|nr:DUF697 domain-containing protein [SAR324 cluster bacterium]